MPAKFESTDCGAHGKNLEGWLQLPDEPAVKSLLDEETPDETVINMLEDDYEAEPDRSDQPTLFPETGIDPIPPDEDQGEIPDEAKVDERKSEILSAKVTVHKPDRTGETDKEPETEDDPAELLESLKKDLQIEFGDTLTGINAMTAPVGLAMLIVGTIGLLMMPALDFLNMRAPGFSNWLVISVISAILVLAGIHLLIYWTFHNVSNIVKGKELDKMLLERRINRPCMHLDCTMTEDQFESESLSHDLAIEIEAGEPGDMQWRCVFFDVDLEGMPLCAVCSKYKGEAVTKPWEERR